MSDPRMKEIGANMPFDGKRMIMGGFEAIVEEGEGGGGSYTDGFVVPGARRQARRLSRTGREDGQGLPPARRDRVIEAIGDDVAQARSPTSIAR